MRIAKWLGATAALGVAADISSGAFAADAVYVEPTYEVVDTAFNWSGVYVGATIGYGGADVDGAYSQGGGTDFLLDGSGPFNLDPDGIAGGLEVGVNWQSGNMVYGIEADVTFVDWSDSQFNAPADEETVFVDTNYVATLRARIGYSMDRTLFFGTAGLAYTDTEYSVQDHPGDTDPTESGSISLNDIGLVAGGGVEHAFNDKWSVKLEGLYFWFNDNQSAIDLTHDSDNSRDFVELNDAWMVRVGLNYHF